MELSERLNYIIKNNPVAPDISEYEFAKKIGTYQSRFSEIRSGKIKSLPPKIALEISKQFDVNFKWLLTGMGTPFENDVMPSKECITIERIHINPSCGSGTVVMGEAEVTPVLLGKKLLQNIFRVSNIEALKVFTATGDSMEDTIYDGDDVLVDTSCDNYTNGGVFVIEKFGEWFIKRLRLKFDGSLEIISDNTRKYQPEVVTLDSGIDINIKGKVIKNLSRGL